MEDGGLESGRLESGGLVGGEKEWVIGVWRIKSGGLECEE